LKYGRVHAAPVQVTAKRGRPCARASAIAPWYMRLRTRAARSSSEETRQYLRIYARVDDRSRNSPTSSAGRVGGHSPRLRNRSRAAHAREQESVTDNVGDRKTNRVAEHECFY
jgi:hypothetical protein